MARTGHMRERVRFDRRGEVADDGYGNETGEFEPIATVAAAIFPMKGSEPVLAGRLQGRVPVEIVIRWSDALGDGPDRLTPNDIVTNVRNGDVFNIRAIENRDMKRQWLTITAEGGVAV